MQEEKGGISIADIFRTISLGKWLALIIAVVMTVAGTLVIHYGYNSSVRRYETEFKLNLPGGYTGDFYTYLDGSQFYYTDMISYKSLAGVKNSNTAFDDIDIEKMIADNAISVGRNVVEKPDETSEIFFSISASAKYFNSQATARSFLTKLAHIPIDNFLKTHFDCDMFLTLAQDADSYETTISLLKYQLDYLTKGYSNLIREYGESFVADGRTILAYSNELSAYNLVNTLNVLDTKVREDGILKSEDERGKYELKKAQLKRQYETAKATLDVLLSAQEQGGSTAIFDASTIKSQSDLVENLKMQIADMTRFIDEGVVDEDGSFQKGYIDPEYESLKNFTETYENVVAEVYSKASTVTFTQVGVISVTGGISLLKSIFISLVLGVVVALIAAYVFGNHKLKKSNTQPGKEKAYTKLNHEQSK